MSMETTLTLKIVHYYFLSLPEEIFAYRNVEGRTHTEIINNRCCKKN